MWHGHAGRPSPGFPPRIGVRGMLLIGGVTIPDRSPGHAFIAIADAGWRAHQGMKIEVAIPDRSLRDMLSPPLAIADAGWRRHTKV